MELEARHSVHESIEQLGPWFHNLHLPEGIQTAPDHFLGDFPMRKWQQIEAHLPKDLSGWNCLDIGCNAGFYSFELAKRGAQVTGIDSDLHFLKQAKWAATQFGLANSPVFRQMQIHELARVSEEFDLVLFMGVFYHLRYPALALDTIASKVKRLMVFQTLTTENELSIAENFEPAEDYSILERDCFHHPGWPKMAFVEKKYSHDETNWWVPNDAAVQAMLRSTGFERISRLAHEIYLCEPPQGGVAKNRAWDLSEWLSATGTAQEMS